MERYLLIISTPAALPKLNFLFAGAPQPELGTFIVGGIASSIQYYPYMASVQVYGLHYCGGSIISPTWVLTAAHCIVRDDEHYSIRAGSSTRNSGGQVIAAAKITVHELYLRETMDYDVAVIQLVRPINTPGARPVYLPRASNSPPREGAMGTIAGWGRLEEGGTTMADTLKVVQVPVLSQEICRQRYGQTVITERKFCAGFWGIGGKDACQNDSGGPLVINGVQTGIISWGAGCARADGPGVYASVPSLRGWIRSKTGL